MFLLLPWCKLEISKDPFWYVTEAIEVARENGYLVGGAVIDCTDDGYSAWLYEDHPSQAIFDVAEVYDTPLEAARSCYTAASQLDPVAYIIE